MLTFRQQLILRTAINRYLQAGQPVGSKALVGEPDIQWGSSTIRSEFSRLEEFGLLAHPYTSAGRVPTDAGYRYFVDNLLNEPEDQKVMPPVELSLQRELDEALQVTTETLSQVTNLLAIVSAPPVHTDTIKHIEVLALQPQVVMVVVITSTGGVSKRIFTFDRAVDSGLVDWSSSYLNERLAGIGLGARILRQRLAQDTLSDVEQGFLKKISAAFTDLEQASEHAIYFEGTAHLLNADRVDDIQQIHELIAMLEQRVSLLNLLQEAFIKRDLYVRIGRENRLPALQSMALVASGYGLPQRSLGAVSVIGPLRMDYQVAINSVRQAARELSRYVEEIYS